MNEFSGILSKNNFIFAETPQQIRKWDYEDIAVLLDGTLLQDKSKAGICIKTFYHQYQKNCISQLKGQFNICIWDKQKKILLLATDRFGTLPLYYSLTNQKLIFSSDISFVLANMDKSPQINKQSLYNYLSFSFIPSPETIYNNVFKLPPGHILTFDNGLKIEKYWDISYEQDRSKGESFYSRKIMDTLESSVKECVKAFADKKIGAFLSGGLDSTAVCGMMSRITGERVMTFSAVFDEAEYSEEGYIDIAARHFNLKSHKYNIKPQDLIHAINSLIPQYGEPFGNSSAIAAYYCVKMARENNAGVILGGDGGDENFAGYTRYVTDKILSLYQKAPAMFRKKSVEDFFSSKFFAGVPFLGKVSRYIEKAKISNPDRFFLYEFYNFYNRASMFEPDFLNQVNENSPLDIIGKCYGQAPTEIDLNRLLYLDTKLNLIDNDLRNKMAPLSRLFNIDIAYPMLSSGLWDLGSRIPHDLKLKGFKHKYIYKKAMAGFLPNDIILKKKHGFGLPYSLWLRRDKKVREFTMDNLRRSQLIRAGILKDDVYDRLLSLHDNEESAYYGNFIWIFLMLELWLMQNSGLEVNR
jgi:asparagine synthase (glutamine-hydrolysing)